MTYAIFPHVGSVDPLWNLLKTVGVMKRVHRERGFYTGFTQVYSQDIFQFNLLFSTR
jgi:hypothetical protein